MSEIHNLRTDARRRLRLVGSAFEDLKEASSQVIEIRNPKSAYGEGLCGMPLSNLVCTS